MTDGKVQPCRNNCGRNVYVSDRTGKWLPYNEGTDNKHDCPNYKNRSGFVVRDSGGVSSNDRLLLDIAEKVNRTDEGMAKFEQELIRLGDLLEADIKERGIVTRTAKELKDD